MRRNHMDVAVLDETLRGMREKFRDVVVPQGMIQAMRDDKGRPCLSLPFDTGWFNAYPSNFAHGQIANRLQIPTPFYRRVLDGHPDEWVRMVNYWFRQDRNEKGMVLKRLCRCVTREDGALDMRAFLSNHYRIIDNLHIMEVALEATAEACDERGGHPEVLNWNLSQDHMDLFLYDTSVTAHLDLFTSGQRTEGKKGEMSGWGGDWSKLQGTIQDMNYDRPNGLRMAVADGRANDGSEGSDLVYGGVHFRNSETGDGSAWVRTCAAVAVCSNRVMIGLDMAQVHLGKPMQEGADILSEETRKLENEVVWARIKDATKAALDPEKFEKLVAKFNSTGDIELPSEAEAVDKVVTREGWNQDQRDTMLARFKRYKHPDRVTVLDVIQAATEAAQEYEAKDPAKCLEMEIAAGRLSQDSHGVLRSYFGVKLDD